MVRFAAHAVERYRERIRPTLTFEQAAAELPRVAEAAGSWQAEPPDWFTGTWRPVRWLMLGTDVAFPVQSDGTAPTCMCRDDNSPDRQGWQRHKRQLRTARRTRNRRKLEDREAGQAASDRRRRQRKNGWDEAA